MGGRSTSSGLSSGTARASSASAERTSSERYHQFTDKPSGTHEFPGGYAGGSDTQKWFSEHSNNDSLLDEISRDRDAKHAFGEWAAGKFMHGQQYQGWDNMLPYHQDLTRQYDKYIDRSVMHEALSVRRLATPELLGLGKGKPTAAQLKALEGCIVKSGGDMSCAAAGAGLTISWDENPGRVGKYIEYKFNIPKGTKGAGMWIGDRRANPSWAAQQREFMMNRDSRWKVGKATYDSARGCYVVEMDWDGLSPHDYGRSGR